MESSTSSAAEEAAASSDHALGLIATFFFAFVPVGFTVGEKESQLSREVVISPMNIGCSDDIKVGGRLKFGATNFGFLPHVRLCRHTYRNTRIVSTISTPEIDENRCCCGRLPPNRWLENGIVDKQM